MIGPANVRFGSTTDYKHSLILCPDLGVKQKKSWARRTLSLEGPLLGAKRTCTGHAQYGHS